MQYGLVFPNMDIHTVPDLAAEAEAAGWDGIFIPDCINIDPRHSGGEPMQTHDPWIVLAAAATCTSKVKLGTMLTPLSRRRPWKIARETVTLDHLSNGRLLLPVGLGALDDQGFGSVGEATDRRERAELLDESLTILDGLWSGKPFSHQGKHYQVEEMRFAPTPVQQPRIPVWVAGLWGSRRSMGRVLRWDGYLPNIPEMAPVTPDIAREMRAFFNENGRPDMQIIIEGSTPANDPGAAVEQVQPLVEAGINWWLDSFWTAPNDTETIRRRLNAGPPRAN